jgi:hydroxymethylbilane synthase
VRRLLSAVHGFGADAIEIVPIRTSGDRLKDRSLADAGGKGLFTKEIDESLLAGRIDIAVHSAKDIPTWLPEGIVIGACLERADVRDAFLSPKAARLADLPAGATVGTSSPRRKAMVLETRPDLSVADMRGNVDSRLRKLDEGEADATFLAIAGLTRLGLARKATSLLEPEDWLPAVGQGTIAIAARTGDPAVRANSTWSSRTTTRLPSRCGTRWWPRRPPPGPRTASPGPSAVSAPRRGSVRAASAECRWQNPRRRSGSSCPQRPASTSARTRRGRCG